MSRAREDILSDIESKKWWLEQAEKTDRDIRGAYSQRGLTGWGSDIVNYGGK